MEYLFPVADFEEDKICDTRDKFKIALTELCLEKVTPLPDHLSRFRLVGIILQTGQRTGLPSSAARTRRPASLNSSARSIRWRWRSSRRWRSGMPSW